jgi:hypothetical protein
MNQKLLLTLLVLSAIVAITQAGPRSQKHEKPRNGSSSQEASKQPKPAYNGSIFHLEGENPSRHGGNKTHHESSEEITILPSQGTTVPPQ